MRTALTSLLVVLFAGACNAQAPEAAAQAAEAVARMTTLPSLKSRMAPEWLAGSKQIRSKEVSIYYRGEAIGEYTPGKASWNGTVFGDLFVVTLGRATICTNGKFTIQGASWNSEGYSRTFHGDDSPWKSLLLPP